jgi:dipeptidyl aminopeptidase/acylaminoacyl peptidase
MFRYLPGILLVGCVIASGQELPRPARTFIEVSISPDARHVAAVEGDSAPRGGEPAVRDLLIRSADGSHAVAVKLPCGAVKGCWPSALAWTPDARRLTFALRDPVTHARSLYQVNAQGGDLSLLLAFNGTIGALRYSPDGQLSMLAVENPAKEVGAVEAGAEEIGDLGSSPPPEQRIAVLEGNRLRWVSPANLFVYEYDWMPDGRGFVATAAPGDGDRNWWVAKLYGFDNDGGGMRPLFEPQNAQQQLAAPKVSRDGARVAFIVGLMSDFGSTGGDLYTVPSHGGAATPITPQLTASVSAIHWNCRDHLEAMVLDGDQTELLDFGNGVAAADGKLLWHGQESLGGLRVYSVGASAAACPSSIQALAHQGFNQPPEIELGPIGKWHDLTHANAGLGTAFPVKSLNWKSDQFDVQGWLVMPIGVSPQQRPPLITVIHGGPAAATEPRFLGASAWQTLLAHGYALFMPNARGSYGQGEAFVTGNVRDFGHGDLRDILAGLDAVTALGLTDPDRIGITGGSYGGFMTMWAVTQTDRFKAAVAGAGISNWQSYYGENGIDEWMIPFFGASVYDDPAVYARSSAINFIRQVHTPTFSYVGAADIECPPPQTLEFGHALKVLGRASSTVIYPGEGHAIRDPDHLADIDARTVAWFDRYLR